MEIGKRANKQSILLAIIMSLIFIYNCTEGYISGKITFAPVFVSVMLCLLCCMALLCIYKINKSSSLIRYIALAGLYVNHVFLTITTEIPLSDFIVFAVLIMMSLMFLDKILLKVVLAVSAFSHVAFNISKTFDNINVLDAVLSLPVLAGFIWVTYGSLKIYWEAANLAKTDTLKKTGDLKHIGDIANYIYEKVTQLGNEIQVLRNGSAEFKESLEKVTEAIEEIAEGSLSVVSDTEKIALHIAELEKTISANQEHIKRVTENMDEIIDNKNQGLKLMSELRDLTKAASDAIREIDKMVNETSINTEKIVSAREFIKQISTQTNILALNAAIEASKAGQSSRGFAVIAEEIRGLSEETNKYLKEIQTYTTALSESVINAVKAVDKVNSAIENEIKGVKEMDNLLDRIHESTTSTQNYMVMINESGETILDKAKKIKESITSLCAVNEECSANTLQSSDNLNNQNPYVESIINLINNLCEMADNLRDKSMEIKMLIDIGLLIDYLEKEGYSNEKLIDGCSKLNITSAYVADETGYVHYCNEEVGRGVNLFSFDKSLEQLLNGVDYIVTPIKRRAEDGKIYKFLCVYRNNKIYEVGMDLTETVAVQTGVRDDYVP